MPYIPKVDRSRVASSGATNAGELNYELTLAIRAHLKSVSPLRYQHINDVIADLDHVRSLHGSAPPISSNTDNPLLFSLWLICQRYIDWHTAHFVNTGHYATNPGRDVLGALLCCGMEFYRRVAVPYEDCKIDNNGDVY